MSRLGGVAIYLGVMTAVLVQYLGARFLGWGSALVGGGPNHRGRRDPRGA